MVTKKLVTSIAATFLVFAANANAEEYLTGPGAKETVIFAGSMIANAGSDPTGPVTLVVSPFGKIVEVKSGHDEEILDHDSIVVDLKTKTILPGLIDTHTHLSGDPGGDYWKRAVDPDEWGVVIAAKNARLTALAGFTTVRDVGSSGQVMQSIRRGTAEGKIPGPRIQTGGNSIAIIGGHADVSGFKPEINEALATGFTCTGPVECAATVRKASKNGSDLIKITATGGVLSQQARGLEAHFTNAEMKAIVDTAHSLGLKVAAHAHGARGIEAASKSGVDSIEHCTFGDDAAIKAMKANNTACVPTLMAYKGIRERLGKGIYTPQVEDKIRATLEVVGKAAKKMHDGGVNIVFGTDSGVYEHGRNAEEFAMMTEFIGMTNREALASATTKAAKLMGLENEIGRIAPGFSADLIAVDGNPLSDIKRLEKIEWVMVRGRIIQ